MQSKFEATFFKLVKLFDFLQNQIYTRVQSTPIKLWNRKTTITVVSQCIR